MRSWFVILFSLTILDLSGQAIYDTLNLLEFEVIGRTFPQIVEPGKQVVDSVTMLEFHQQDLSALILVATPAFVKDYGRGSLSTVSVNGAGPTHTQVMWEGFLINPPTLGMMDFSMLPVAYFSKLEMLYGSSSLESYHGGMGGIVSLSSHESLPEGHHIMLNQSIGSFSTLNSLLGVGFRKNRFSSSTRLLYQTSNNDFPYLNNAVLPAMEMRQQNAQYKQGGFIQEFEWATSEVSSLRILSWNHWVDRNLPPVMTNVFRPQEENQWVFDSRNVIEWKRNGPSSVINLSAAWFGEQNLYRLETMSSDSTGQIVHQIASDNRLNSVLLSGSYRTSVWKFWILKLKFDGDHQVVTSSDYQQTVNQNTLSMTAVLSRDWGKQFGVKLLIRQLYRDDKWIAPLPLAVVSIKPIDEVPLSFYFQTSANYKQPRLNDMYYYPMGNPDLKAEQSVSGEIGGVYSVSKFDNWSMDITVDGFLTQYHNWIQWMPGAFSYWEPVNLYRVNAKGMDAGIQSRWSVRELKLMISARYSLSKTLRKNNTEKWVQVPYLPSDQLKWEMKLLWRKMALHWNGQWVGERYTTLDDDKTRNIVLPPYMVNNLSGEWMLTSHHVKFKLRGTIYNVFNVQYQAVQWRAMPGRNFELSLAMEL